MRFEALQRISGNLLARERYGDGEFGDLNPIVAAYVGDAWYSLFVRTRLLRYEQRHAQVLQRCSGDLVSAQWQAVAYRAIEPALTDEERETFRRGRNAHSHAPRSSDVATYHTSTGFEALLGSLYLCGAHERLAALADMAFDAVARLMAKENTEGTLT